MAEAMAPSTQLHLVARHALRTLLDRVAADKDALAAYLDLYPENAAAYVVRSVCAQAGPLIDTFAKVKNDRLPEVDACLLSLLQKQPGKSGRANFVWKQRVTAAARFGTPALLPAIELSGMQQLAANPNDSGVAGSLLAAEMRDDPQAALVRLQRDKPSTVSWYETDNVFESAQQPFPPAVTAWLRDQVRTGGDDAASQAAYQLSIGGKVAHAS